MLVLFLKSFAAFMGLTLLMAWCHWLYEEEVNIGFYTDNAKWVLLFCLPSNGLKYFSSSRSRLKTRL